MTADQQYLQLIRNILEYGEPVPTRNSPVQRMIAVPVTFTSTPLVCVRKTAWKNALREWEWFMSGSNNIKDLHDSVRKWWEPWANQYGFVIFNYSHQFRRQTAIDDEGGQCQFDQIRYMIDGIREHPTSRRNVISTWYTPEMVNPDCPISNCHGTVIQAFVEHSNLTLVTYQRSCDLICGVPHNWVQYWAFLLWLCHRTDRKPGRLVWIGGDVHLYSDHEYVAKRILSVPAQTPPELVYTPTSDEFRTDDFTLDREYTPVITDSVKMVV